MDAVLFSVAVATPPAQGAGKHKNIYLLYFHNKFSVFVGCWTLANKRSTSKQDSFKKKLLTVRKNIQKCDICDEIHEGNLLGTHIVGITHADMLREAYYKNENLPPGVSEAQNGLLLCPNCQGYFDKPQPEIRISHDGTLIMNEKCKKNHRYKDLDGTKVPWANKIGRPNYPSQVLLQLALPLMNSKYKRALEVFENDEDDDSEDEYPVQMRSSAKRSAKLQVRFIIFYSSSNI